jgi:hypothetical protein
VGSVFLPFLEPGRRLCQRPYEDQFRFGLVFRDFQTGGEPIEAGNFFIGIGYGPALLGVTKLRLVDESVESLELGKPFAHTFLETSRCLRALRFGR